jgi:hypothetical protein
MDSADAARYGCLGPEAMPKADLKNPDVFIPRDLFAAYVGPGSEALLRFYDKVIEKGNPSTLSFDLLAILALPAWFGLHRLWAMWGTYTLLIGILPFIEHVVGHSFPAGALVGTSIAMGLLARGLLVSSANALYLKLKRGGLAPDAVQKALEGRAQASVPLAFAGGVASVAVIVGLGFLADSVLGGG